MATAAASSEAVKTQVTSATETPKVIIILGQTADDHGLLEPRRPTRAAESATQGPAKTPPLPHGTRSARVVSGHLRAPSLPAASVLKW
ncbi:hypothetical protein GCM10017559_64460 [Streptosporangium longisporum]|uniref:Metalloenzyme domain-containing protein n=1 Tax=Streptosporangium longisporum TaxID=46187 RepID=A0ABP6L0W1_9ACTN